MQKGANNALRRSGPSPGGKLYQLKERDLADVVRDVLQAYAPRLQREGFVVELTAPADPLPPVRIDFRHHEATKSRRPIVLSPREFMFFAYLVAHRGAVITREQQLDAVWGYDNMPFTRTVDTHVAKLRKKIEDDPANARYLITLHRLGYKFLG